MPDPFRLRVLKALTSALEEIAPVNGYVNDVSSAVFRGRLYFGDADPLPMLSVLEPPIAPEQLPQPKDGTQSNGEWDLLIQGFVEDDKDNPTDPAYTLLAEVKKQLAIVKMQPEADRLKTGESSHLLGIKGVDKLEIGSGTVRPPDEVSAKAYFWLNVTLGIAEDLLLPYE